MTMGIMKVATDVVHLVKLKTASSASIDTTRLTSAGRKSVAMEDLKETKNAMTSTSNTETAATNFVR